MSHLIVDGVDHVITPADSVHSDTWHGLHEHPEENPQAILPDGSNVSKVLCPIVSCGLKPDMGNAELVTLAAEDAEACEVDLTQYKLIMADLRNNGKGFMPLYVPKAGYSIHQNSAIFDSTVKAAEVVLGAGGFEIATVGTLGAYSQFFVSLAIKGRETMGEGNEKHALFFNSISSHNGLVANAAMLSAVRVVCMNTVQMSLEDAGQSGRVLKFKHSKNSAALVTPESFAERLEAWIECAELHASFMAGALATPMNEDGFKAFAAGVFTNDKSDELSTISFNRIAELAELFRTGRGNSGKTLWDAINAFTEFFTHGNGVGSTDKVRANKRLASANFGRGNQWKLEAIRIAKDESEMASVCKRGANFYADKVKVEEAKL